MLAGALALAVVLAPQVASAQLLGQALGDPASFISQGDLHYKKGRLKKAQQAYLKAARAAPGSALSYLPLALTYSRMKKLPMACHALAAHSKTLGEPPSADKAVASLVKRCTPKRRKGVVKPVDTETPKFEQLKEGMQGALDKRYLYGPGSAGHMFRELVAGGYLGTDLPVIAGKIFEASMSEIEALYRKAHANEAAPSESMRNIPQLYKIAVDTALSPPGPKLAARAKFIEGSAELRARKLKRAEEAFAEANKSDKDEVTYEVALATVRFLGGVRDPNMDAIARKGGTDPRAEALRLALALEKSPREASVAIEELFAAEPK
jgi:tetratricopeptide (TPR) repeat protein